MEDIAGITASAEARRSSFSLSIHWDGSPLSELRLRRSEADVSTPEPHASPHFLLHTLARGGLRVGYGLHLDAEPSVGECDSSRFTGYKSVVLIPY